MRVAELDVNCGWCLFEGRRVLTFAYREPRHGEIYHWCPWHQENVPPTKGKDRIPPSAQAFPSIGRTS